jgi:Caspase domain
VENDALLDYKALRVAHILNRVESRGCHLNLIILDACRSKPPSMRGGTRDVGRGLAKIEATAGSIVAFACEPHHTASDGNGRNGAFTEQLLKNICRPGVDVDFMLGDVAAAVEKSTGGMQKPFRNHNLQGKRPCCLLEGEELGAPPASPAVASPTPAAVEEELAAFLADCHLDTDQRAQVAVALRDIGVTSASHLDVCDEDDLKQLKVPPVVFKVLRSSLAARKSAGPSAGMASSGGVSETEAKLKARKEADAQLKARLLQRQEEIKKERARIAALTPERIKAQGREAEARLRELEEKRDDAEAARRAQEKEEEVGAQRPDRAATPTASGTTLQAAPAFVNSGWQGARPGYHFTTGPQGTGYYLDVSQAGNATVPAAGMAFVASSWQGARPGYCFTTGPLGTGYYPDLKAE